MSATFSLPTSVVQRLNAGELPEAVAKLQEIRGITRLKAIQEINAWREARAKTLIINANQIGRKVH